ncbi:acetyltransferase [Sporormia fimetaria CBS 119925]|uniref:Acetyltransferase n=1 Tax=Sporormia fimetaria CBS 119925 TaxID=1340428 RepID=A0A6A6V2V5_9PLEO|nr:acetyltransferase [Sporormia fimetaria CBS 119925]
MRAYPSVEPKTPTTPNAPELRTYVAETDNDRAAALRLVTDSVAQQRQQASKSLLFHPLNLGAYVLTVALFVRSLWATNDDLPLLITVLFALTATCLVVIRYASSHYTTFAEHIDWDWLGEDRCIVVKWGGEIIGALVLGWADNSEGAKKRGTRRRRGKAVVRAWTVRGKYRGKGVGKALLEEAVRVAGERGADGILFERDHANSKRILPGIYNGYLNNQEAKAEKALEKVADEKGNFRQRRSSPTWGSR